MAFDALLFRPCNVVWPEKAPNRDGELHAGTGIGRNQSLANCNIQNPPKYPQLLMNGRWFQRSSFSVPESGFDEPALAHAFPKIRFGKPNGKNGKKKGRTVRMMSCAITEFIII